MYCVLQPIVQSKVASKEEIRGDSTAGFVTIVYQVSDYEISFCISEANNIHVYSTC
jgi:hypothetical protein